MAPRAITSPAATIRVKTRFEQRRHPVPTTSRVNNVSEVRVSPPPALAIAAS